MSPNGNQTGGKLRYFTVCFGYTLPTVLPEEKIVRYPDLTERDAQLVEETLRSIVESTQFRKSKRYPAFLDFIVRNSRTGNFDVLKERILGAEIFSREPDWDAGNDSIVRNAAVEVRKRMALYFSEHPEGPVRIDLPPGSYIAEFHFRSPETNALHASGPQELNVAAMASTSLESRLGKMWMWLWTPRWRAGLAVLLLLLVVVAVVSIYLRSEAQEHAFWDPVLRNNRPAVIVTGGPYPSTIPSRQPSAPDSNQQPGTSDSSQDTTNWRLNDPAWVSKICDAFFIYSKGDCKIFPAASLAIPDLHNKSVVLLGELDNALADRFMALLRYQFRTTPWVSSVPHQERIIVDQFHPETVSTWRVNHDPPTKDPNDYAIVARFHSELTDSPVVVIAGLRPEGTTYAGEFIASPAAFKQIASQAPKDWGGLNFEAVLHTEPAPENPDHVKIMATYFW
jgi:hypothetical protein